MTTAIKVLALPLLALFFAGCVSGAAPASAPSDGAPAAGVTVEVTNAHRSDITVYVVRGGARSRLGITVSGNTTRFPLRDARIELLGDVRLHAEVIGSDAQFTTQRIAVRP
ncbi:MAG TPA: hypothetical protein VE913_23835, partial [Longimicrobium sp.]|nr:hypothetical protein [Longimicrobium sp.]